MRDKHRAVVLRGAITMGVTVASNLAFFRYGNVFALALQALGAAALTVGMGWLFDRHDAKLTARAQAGDQGAWEVQLNGIRLGAISDSDYATMEQAVFRDARVAIAQLMNVGRVALVAGEKLLLSVPIWTFWAVASLALVAPESYTDLVRELQKADPATITVAATQFISWSLMFGVLTFGFMAFFGYRFGFKNCYSESVGQLVRQHFRCPADGSITLYRRMQFKGASA